MSGSTKIIKCINPPKECNICRKSFGTFIYDAKTVYGPWAYMCEDCFNTIGVGLGTGLGQQYKKNDSGDWVKVVG